MTVGKITVSHIPDTVFEEKDAFEKWAIKFKHLREDNLVEDISRLLRKNLVFKNVANEIQAWEELKCALWGEYLSFKSFHNENPFVVYIEVFDHLGYLPKDSDVRAERKIELIEKGVSPCNNRGRGIGKELYKAGSILMASLGKTLNSDTLQSEDAVNFWKHNCMKIPNCTAYQYVEKDGETYTRYRIDYISEFEAVKKTLGTKKIPVTTPSNSARGNRENLPTP